MKRKNIKTLGIITMIILSSCESLDLEVRTTTSAEQVEKNYQRTMNHCTSVYNVLLDGFATVSGTMMASACDESEFTTQASNIQKFNTGSWSPYDNPDDVWGRYFRGIRLADNFLVMSDSVNLENLRLDPNAATQTLYQQRVAEIKRWKYEVRFLRALFYFELVKRYGGVAVITEKISPEADFSQVPRNTLAECIKFITDECDSCANKLPVNYATVTTDYGRVTKGAAFALKSRVLLYAASDLFNTPPADYAYPELVSMPTDVTRAARWQAAADAALAVINLAGTAPYALNNNYRNLFHAYNNSEIVFARRGGVSNSFEKANYPIGYDQGNSGNTPSQNLVDAFEVKTSATTSVPFDWNNPSHVSNIYNFGATFPSRDPRLGLIVITNNSTYKGRPVECWTNGKDGSGVPNATRTGYYLKKYVDENLNLLTGATSVHTWLSIRYAEVLLNYAEAINEANPGNVALAKTRVDAVRTRAGIAMPVLPAGLTQAQMRDRIRNERRVELAFEDHRAWDVRRWMQGETYFNVPLRGLNITQVSAGVFTYQPIDVESRVFESKMYFYPIPQAELNIMKNWVQNPGW